MKAVEIEETIYAVAAAHFDPEEFPCDFLQAFRNKGTIMKCLCSGASNKSDSDGVLQINNINTKTCLRRTVTETFAALWASPATARQG